MNDKPVRPWHIFRTVRALKQERVSQPWRLAWDLCVKTPLLPHRTYIYSDCDGFRYQPLILHWNLWGRTIWTDRAEMRRQRRNQEGPNA